MDLRLPVGVLFLVLGALLAGYGAVTNAQAGAGPKVNVNLIWGAAMLVCGALMLVAALVLRRKTRK